MNITYVGRPKRKHLELPFFAYGNLKPGQLSYHRIKKYVKGEPSAEIIEHEMYYRDGFAFIDGEENENFKTSGYLIEFTNPQIAYKRIAKSWPKDLYEWKVIKVNGKDANALVGVDKDCGSFDNREYPISTYDYRQDSFFNEALELIESILNEFEDKEIKDMRDFFKFQMHYMLLWSVIERFCTLSYGYFGIGSNKFNFAKQKPFKYELKTNVNREDVIYSSDKLEDNYLDPCNHRDSIKYYYTVRCNVVHKGKAVKDDDMNKLKYSLEELYKLFIVVYNDKLIENDKTLEKYPEKRFERN